jgi:hypothetical protein
MSATSSDVERQRPHDVVGREDPAVAQVDDPLARLDRPRDVLRGGTLREREVHGTGTALVGGAHVRVVGGERVEAGDQLAHERVLVDRERRVAEDLVGEGGCRAHRGGRAAERAEPVGRVDRGGACDLGRDAAHRAPLRSRERFGELGAQQVGTSHAAEQERAAGEQREVLAPDVEGERDVVGRVPGGVEDPDEAGVGGELRLVLHLMGGEGDVHARGHDVLGLQHPGELEPAADVVVVEVGLQDVGHGPAALVEDGFDPVDVALGVDDDGGTAASDHVAAVSQVGGLDRDDVEACHEVVTFAPADTRSGYPPERL